MSKVHLPDTLRVLERGWLSSNNILAFDGEAATLIDSGYVSHAAQTVDLVAAALGGRRLTHLINTHSHSDHIGGNATVQARFGCSITVPAGIAEMVSVWDEAALMLTPLGQQGERFAADGVLHAGDELVFGEMAWQALAVPGHDMDALAYYNPEQRLLISGDALWQDGFGVIFAELLGDPEGLRQTRATLAMLGRLPINTVIPGHGAPFADVDAALRRAEQRLAGFESAPERLVRHALRVALVFLLLDRRQVASRDLPELLAGLSFVSRVGADYLGLDSVALAEWLRGDLLRSGALQEVDGILYPAG